MMGYDGKALLWAHLCGKGVTPENEEPGIARQLFFMEQGHDVLLLFLQKPRLL